MNSHVGPIDKFIHQRLVLHRADPVVEPVTGHKSLNISHRSRRQVIQHNDLVPVSD